MGISYKNKAFSNIINSNKLNEVKANITNIDNKISKLQIIKTKLSLLTEDLKNETSSKLNKYMKIHSVYNQKITNKDKEINNLLDVLSNLTNDHNNVSNLFELKQSEKNIIDSQKNIVNTIYNDSLKEHKSNEIIFNKYNLILN